MLLSLWERDVGNIADGKWVGKGDVGRETRVWVGIVEMLALVPCLWQGTSRHPPDYFGFLALTM